ncbi:MAG: ribose-phosphate diphosphokinase [Rickettsiales bacterium]|nr:ribose-phosphate diphosphokinase [Rickettsiales bacterium]
MPEPKPSLILTGNNASPAIAHTLEAANGFSSIPASIGQFGSSEPFVELFHGQESDAVANAAALKNAKTYVVQSTNEPASEHCQHLLLMAHTLKHYGANEVTAVMPFAAFARQDREFKNRFASVAAEFFPKQLKAAGVDRVITVTPHSEAAVKFYQNEFGNRFTALSATQLFADDIKKRFGEDLPNVMIGAPDGADKPLDAGQQRARELCDAVFGAGNHNASLFKISKTHIGVSDTKITGFEGDVIGKHCVIVDDMIDGGSTIINAASLLKARGAASVTAYATHGILSNNALEKILSVKPDGMTPAIDRLIVTDTIPSVEQKIATLAEKQPTLALQAQVLSVGPMVAAEIARQDAIELGFADSIKPGGQQRLTS